MIKGIIFDFVWALWHPDKDVIPPEYIRLLEELREKGYKLALISSISEEREGQVKSISQFFDHIDLVDIKTTEAFNNAAKALMLSPGEILVVGDRIREEITIGNELGMETTWLNHGRWTHETPFAPIEKPKHTIKKLSEIKGILAISGFHK